jgi:hypothetical protein
MFGLNKANWKREQLAGLSTTAVYLAKSIVSLIITAVSSGIFRAWWGWLAQPVADPGLYFLLFWLLYFCGTGIGFLMSISLRYDLAGMSAILIVLICSVFSKSVASAGGGQTAFQEFVSYFSFLSWGGQAFYTLSVEPFNATKTTWMENAYRISPEIQPFAWCMVLCLAIMFRIFAWARLVYEEE